MTDTDTLREALEKHHPDGVWSQPCGNIVLICGCGENLWGVDRGACKAAWRAHVEAALATLSKPEPAAVGEHEALIAAGFSDYEATCALRTDDNGVFCHAYLYSDHQWRFQTGGNDLTLAGGATVRCVLTRRLYANPPTPTETPSAAAPDDGLMGRYRAIWVEGYIDGHASTNPSNHPTKADIEFDWQQSDTFSALSLATGDEAQQGEG